ncbi:hypothetical protein SARC_00329 [Sphaeroforma arctica JP610]|uniref:Uncharacterized protein n=1 Tax=Sphaeroforma arctica JP610 TaxID=667725 RepID=A0A0L0GFE7_9EUKA|nr:hypothetical protein SARC_00329 [Sphaeroforma arctica JP610]KNC87564.1 hypothetical protein SARC_00329 [Sphaeroforma arctica JP610]|eukprot:XP_014161466.1 hypothetical protein SARC_00329 [Sphaeroforma arctica JP610]
MAYVDTGSKPAMLLQTFVERLHCKERWPSYLEPPSYCLLPVRPPPIATSTLYEIKSVDFFVSDWLPRDCEVLFGFDHLQENLIGISWDQSTSPPQLQLDLPWVKYPVGFLISQAPEQLAKINLPPIYEPQDEKIPDEYDFRHLDRPAKILNKGPSEL